MTSLLGRLVRSEERAAPFNQAWPSDSPSFTANYSGRTINAQTALELVPVYAATRIIASSIGSLPLVVYRKDTAGRERAQNHRTWRLLHDQPNEHMAADEVWEIVAAHLCLWGNAFLAKFRDGFGVVNELIPLNPSRVQVGEQNGRRVFVIDGQTDNPYTDTDVLHIRGMSNDGLVGYSPIQLARNALAAGMQLEEFTGRFWANNATPGGVLKHPNRLTPEVAQRLRDSWKANHSGPSRAGSIAVLEEGMTWESSGMPLDDAQFIQTAQFNDLRVAQLFRVPPHMLGAPTGDSMTYANVEQQGIDFVRWSLRPWLVRIERSLLRDPSLFTQGQRFFCEFLVDGLLRGDTASRYAAYETAIRAGFLDVDEVRDMENRAPKTSEPAPADEPEENQ